MASPNTQVDFAQGLKAAEALGYAADLKQVHRLKFRMAFNAFRVLSMGSAIVPEGATT